jgi:hypothetical protein
MLAQGTDKIQGIFTQRENERPAWVDVIDSLDSLFYTVV